MLLITKICTSIRAEIKHGMLSLISYLLYVYLYNMYKTRKIHIFINYIFHIENSRLVRIFSSV